MHELLLLRLHQDCIWITTQNELADVVNEGCTNAVEPTTSSTSSSCWLVGLAGSATSVQAWRMGSGHKDRAQVGAQEHGSASAEPQPSVATASNQKRAARPSSFATLRVNTGRHRAASVSVVQWACAER